MRTLLLLMLVCLPLSAQRFPPPALVSSKRAEAGGGGSPTWYDAEPQASTDSNAFSANDDTSWTPITVGQSGNITKVRIYIATRFGAQNVKLAVFDNSNNLLQQVVAADPGGTGYYEPAITPIAVSASDTVKVAWTSDGGNLIFRYLAGVGTFDWNVTAGNYAAFAPASLPASSGPIARRFAVGVYVE